MKLENRKSVATDHDGFEIRIGDTVKEIQGELRQGTILHIHRAFAFLYNRELNEHLGVFTARTINLATIAAKGARINTGPDLNKMNPAMQRRTGPGNMPPPAVMRTGGRDRAIGMTVIVRQGPYKGLLGIIKDTTDVTARVELHSNLRTVSLEKTKLTYKTFLFLNSKLIVVPKGIFHMKSSQAVVGALAPLQWPRLVMEVVHLHQETAAARLLTEAWDPVHQHGMQVVRVELPLGITQDPKLQPGVIPALRPLHGAVHLALALGHLHGEDQLQGDRHLAVERLYGVPIVMVVVHLREGKRRLEHQESRNGMIPLKSPLQVYGMHPLQG